MHRRLIFCWPSLSLRGGLFHARAALERAPPVCWWPRPRGGSRRWRSGAVRHGAKNVSPALLPPTFTFFECNLAKFTFKRQPRSCPAEAPATLATTPRRATGCQTPYGTCCDANAKVAQAAVQSEAMVPGSGSVPSLPERVHNRMVELTDPTTLKDMHDLRGRIRELDKIMGDHNAPRGLFTSLYRVITNGAVDSVEKEMYQDNKWASELTHNFGRRYLANLHGDLTGGEVTGAWKAYYKQARDPKVSRERVTGMGAIVHLVADLPKALQETGVPKERRDDFMYFGDVLLEVYPEMIESAKKGHGVDMHPLFDMFKIGDAVDAVAGQGTATRAAYQTIRNKTWYAARGLDDFRQPAAQAEIDISWRGFAKLLAGLDATGHFKE